ncbi:T6SS immunity protein Tli4 family protein [Pseudomonas sp. NPDC090233]|uniref:T6SS immunity protein Tli4 family protein n=1 Tax=Pseudomonas sp. NPDC090233 TaxID=3364479 RepID=UPI00383B559C
MERTEADSKTVLVGRYKLDLPTHAVLNGALLELDGVPMSITPNYLMARVERDAQKKWLSVSSRNLNNSEHTAIQEKMSNGASIYNYDHTRISGEGLDGEQINKVVYSTVAYYGFNNMKFELGNDSTLNKDAQIRSIIENLVRSQTTSKQEICYVNGCLPHNTGSEGVYVNFGFAKYPDLRAKFTSKQYGGQANQPLSQRGNIGISPSDEAKWILNSDAQHRTIRNTKRTVNEVIGEEVIEASTEKSGDGYLTEINAVWYYPGIPNSDESPELRFDMDYSYTTITKPAQGAAFPPRGASNAISEAEFMKIWDQALNSLASR